MRKGNVNVDVTVIPALIDQGLSDLEIASRMGWKVSTLRVRCSQLKISLRRRFKQVVVPKHLLSQLHQRAALMGMSTNTLIVDLLEEIARDNLYDAVLDKRDTEEVCAPVSPCNDVVYLPQLTSRSGVETSTACRSTLTDRDMR